MNRDCSGPSRKKASSRLADCKSRQTKAVNNSTSPEQSAAEANALPVLSSSTEVFWAVARLIAGQDAPLWLVDYLRRFSPTLAIDIGVCGAAPSRSNVKERLEGLRDAADLLARELEDNYLHEFLDAHDLDQLRLVKFKQDLRVLRSSAAKASNSPGLTSRDGKAKPGRGRAMPADGFSAKVACCAIIVEAWKYLHDCYPAPRNIEVARAASDYWRLSGGTNDGWSVDNPDGGWRKHFTKALSVKASGPLLAYKAEARRHLGLSADGTK